MKKLVLVLLVCLSALRLNAQVDSTRRAELSGKLEEYCAAMVTETAQVQCDETDYIIGSCSDEETRQYVATWLYDHFYRSKVMGADAVAIHIYDKWFADGTVKMADDLTFLTAGIFAQFNRESLIGCKAPELTLRDADGNAVELFHGPSDRPSVLYFYSPDCAKCKVENVLLRNVLENRDCPVDIYAVCTSTDREKWQEVVHGSLDFSVSTSRVFHLWDPSGDKDWQLKYGLLQTPKLFLVDSDGTILGRSMDSFALDKMLESMFEPVHMTYGEDESEDFYNKLFASYKEEHGTITAGNLESVASHIALRTLEEAADTMLFKQMTGDLLYYLSNTEEGGLRNGGPDFIETWILSRSDIWNTPDDTLQVIGLANMMDEVLSRTPVGSRMPSVTVYGKVAGSRRVGKTRIWNLSLLPQRISYVMLYSPMCQDCQLQLEALKGKFENDRKLRVLEVDVDSMEQKHPDSFQKLVDTVDLTHVPFIMKTENGKVTGKYESFL